MYTITWMNQGCPKSKTAANLDDANEIAGRLEGRGCTSIKIEYTPHCISSGNYTSDPTLAVHDQAVRDFDRRIRGDR